MKDNINLKNKADKTYNTQYYEYLILLFYL